MAHRFKFTVEVTLERSEGKFASRDEMIEAIVEWLDQANQDSIQGIGPDSDSSYDVSDWSVGCES